MSSFKCPQDVVHGSQEVINGLYETPGLNGFSSPPTILDIGGNVGAYSFWASHRYPGATIHAYEPVPSNAAFFRENMAIMTGAKVKLNEAAVVGDKFEGDKVDIFIGGSNCGCSSMYNLGEQTGDKIEAAVIRASQLPPAHLLKLDTEGAELEILASYKYLKEVVAVAFEWHRPGDKWHIGSLLSNAGLRFLSEKNTLPTPNRGTMIFGR